VLGLGAVVVAVTVGRGGLHLVDVVDSLDLPVLLGLFGLAVGLGTVAGAWSGPARLMHAANAGETAAIGAVGAVLLNNLPAAVLLGSRLPAHPRALLVGLDLGPNLAVSGSLSALLWFKAATKSGARPSIARVTQIGLVLVPCSLVAALGALAIFAPSRL
jgi:arsenical pump membrane protein